MAEMANALAFSSYDDASNILAAKDTPRDRDSGVFLSDSEDCTPAPSRQPSIKLTPPSSKNPQAKEDTTPRRLRRPAELNLSTQKKEDPAKPKSELELRYDLIRNSSSQNRAALKSPTQLLKDRLNLSPKKDKHEEKVRVFTPPRPMLNGCILPPPQSALQPFQGSSVRAKTEREGRPAWWCKFDKLVVFDGVEGTSDGGLKFNTRTSKGLSIARRRGQMESVVIPLDCEHCKEMLAREEWKYDIQVCKRGVCWDCRERCRWEHEQELERPKEDTLSQEKSEANRERADSVLQDVVQDEELCRKVGIEPSPASPIEAVGGIEERMEETVPNAAGDA